MTWTPEEAELLAWLKGALPSWFFTTAGISEEVWSAIVKALGPVRDLAQTGFNATFRQYATGTWVDQHARDLGTNRQYGESDDGLIARLRTPLEAVTYAAILDGITTLLDSYHVSWTPNLIEVRKDGAYLLTLVSPAGLGDSLTVSGDDVTLDDSTATLSGGSSIPGYTFSGYEVGREVKIIAATDPANNGTWPITAVSGDHAIVFTNAAGVTETSSFDWVIDANTNGRDAAYLDRGYRCADSCIIIILPSTCTAAMVSSVRELVRQRKAAGVYAMIEQET